LGKNLSDGVERGLCGEGVAPEIALAERGAVRRARQRGQPLPEGLWAEPAVAEPKLFQPAQTGNTSGDGSGSGRGRSPRDGDSSGISGGSDSGGGSGAACPFRKRDGCTAGSGFHRRGQQREKPQRNRRQNNIVEQRGKPFITDVVSFGFCR
jgi:hypothetical protein